MTQQIVKLICDNPQGMHIWAALLGNAEVYLANSNRGTPLIGNTETFWAFFKTASEFATCPHANRHVHPEAMGTETRQDSWKRIANEAREYMQDPN